MEGKKEVQETIIPKQTNNKITEEEFLSILKTVAPGTNIRTALEGTVKAGKGALIVVEKENLASILDGGFRVNCRFTPQRLIELTKMDGAIILSKDMKKINQANVLLTPNSSIKTNETGTRHKAAERTAKQIGTLVIAISERKHDITLYYKNVRYQLKNTDEILRKANENIQLVERQRELFDSYIDKLNRLELRNFPSLHKAIECIKKGRIIIKIAEDLKRPIVELGSEGILIKTRLKEILSGVEKETNLVVKDYTSYDFKRSKAILDNLNYEEILDNENILRALGYEKIRPIEPIKGWRILSKTSLTDAEIASLIKEMGSLGRVIHTSIRNYSEIIGEKNAQMFKEEIERIKLNP